MRLRLFDRIRRLARFRRPPADAAEVSGAQGRHRRVGAGACDGSRGPGLAAPGPAGRAGAYRGILAGAHLYRMTGRPCPRRRR